MKHLIKLFKKLAYSTKYSFDGLCALWVKEQSFRLEIYLMAVLIPLALYLPFNNIYKLILIILLLLLVTTEILNSAIEVVVDRISMEIHRNPNSPKILAALLLP